MERLAVTIVFVAARRFWRIRIRLSKSAAAVLLLKADLLIFRITALFENSFARVRVCTRRCTDFQAALFYEKFLRPLDSGEFSHDISRIKN